MNENEFHYAIKVPLCYDNDGNLTWSWVCSFLKIKNHEYGDTIEYHDYFEDAKKHATIWSSYQIYKINKITCDQELVESK